jgi:DNA polymerase III sliding clamp (beta) subunit (PCNA family)
MFMDENQKIDDLDIKMGGPLSPAIFRPLNDESYLYLLLPLRG